jgi:hypothetical protein
MLLASVKPFDLQLAERGALLFQDSMKGRVARQIISSVASPAAASLFPECPFQNSDELLAAVKAPVGNFLWPER